MDGVWVDKTGTFRRRWLCRCGNQRPDDMEMCGSCDTDRPRDDARDVFAICDAVEALEKALEERTCPDCGKPVVCGGWCINDPLE